MFQLNLNAMDGADGELISVDLIDDKLFDNDKTNNKWLLLCIEAAEPQIENQIRKVIRGMWNHFGFEWEKDWRKALPKSQILRISFYPHSCSHFPLKHNNGTRLRLN